MSVDRLLLCALLATVAPLAAAQPDAASAPDKASKDARATAVSPELLEFLGSWETATGTWNETMPDYERSAETPTRSPKEKTRND